MKHLLPIAILMAFMILMLIVSMLAFTRMYVKVRPGQVLIRTGMGGMRATYGAGIMVYPILHACYPLHAETETITFAGERLAVQLKMDLDSILTAANAFGAKTPDETREVLQVLADSAKEDRDLLKAKLAEVGYRIL